MLKDIKIGDVIGGKYKVLAILGGEGFSGMGIVYICEATDSEGILALKTFQDKSLFNPQAIEKFQQETLLWLNLDQHPHIVNLLFFDIIDERPFLGMEPIIPDDFGRNTLTHHINPETCSFIECMESIVDYYENEDGKTVENESQVYLDGFDKSFEKSMKRLNEEYEIKIINWAIQLCDGLEYAKSRGLSPHRDIKPDNIMITSEGILKITDFGISKANEEIFSSKSTNFSKEMKDFLKDDIEKNYYGSPPYMSPEHFEGFADERSDIYSIGVTLFESLSWGELPFNVDEEDPKYLDKLYLKHKNDYIPKINLEIYPIIHKCLNKNPNDRYSNYKSLRNDLNELYRNKTGNNYSKIENHVGEIIIPNTDILNVNKSYSFSQLGLFEDASNAAKKAIENNPNLNIAHFNHGVSNIHLENHEKSIKSFKKSINLDYSNADAHYNLAISLTGIGDFDRAIEEYKLAIKYNSNFKQAYVNLGVIYLYEMDSSDKSIECFKKAIKIDKNFFPAIVNLGLAFNTQEEHKKAIEQFKKAEKLNQKSFILYHEWGIALSKKNKHKEAIKKYIKSITINPDSSQAHYNFGVSLLELNNYNPAITEFNKAYELDNDNIFALISLGYVYVILKDYKKIELTFEKISSLQKGDINIILNLGIDCFHLCDIDNAKTIFNEVLKLDGQNIEAKKYVSLCNEYEENSA